VALHLTVSCQLGAEPRQVRTHHDAYRALQADLGRTNLAQSRVRSSNGDLDEWMSAADEARRNWKQDGVPIERRRPLLLETLNRLYETK